MPARLVELPKGTYEMNCTRGRLRPAPPGDRRFAGRSRKPAWKAAASLLLLLMGCDYGPAGPRLSEANPTEVHAWALEAAALIDQHRATLGCAPLRWHDQAAAVATAYARQMNDEAFFGHVDPAGTTLKQRLMRGGVSGYRLAAETIAAGQDNPHKAIVEDCQFDHVGVGFHAGDGPYREYWTAVFVSTR
jgi:uncharacterized protein YkwD